MVQLHQDYTKFVAKDTVIVAIGPDSAKAYKDYWNTQGFLFFGLPDEGHQVLKLLGQEVNWLKLGRMPAQLLIDKSGIVRYVHYSNSMQDIPDNKQILDFIDTL